MDQHAADSRLKALLATWSGLVAANLALGLVYWVVGVLALQVTRGTGLASPIWPSAGLAFAVVYQYGPRLLPAVFLGSLSNNIHSLLDAHQSLPVTLPIAAAIALGAVLSIRAAGVQPWCR